MAIPPIPTLLAHQAAILEDGGSHWLNCTDINTVQLLYWGQMTNLGHCLYNTMAR